MKPVRAVIVQDLGAKPFPLLERVLEAAGFWTRLAQVRRASGLRPGRFRILIKPDLDCYGPTVNGGTDPALVEHLIELLHRKGFTNVAIGDGRNEHDAWLHNREPLVVPDLTGYRFATAGGGKYDVVDLRDGVTEPWSKANFRINFAKNKTHEEFAYALCVHNLAGATARKDPAARPRWWDPSDDCIEVLRNTPPHFNIVDAYTSCHGGAGHRAPSTMQTHAFIASADALLADWAAAAKMGLDPHASPVNDASLRQIGLPARHEIDGDLAPYPFWRNVHPLVSHSARLRNGSEGLGRIATSWFQTVDRERFPFRDFYNDSINAFVAPLVAQLEDNPRAFWIVVLLNYAIARLGSAIVAQYTMLSKGRIARREAPLRFDPACFGWDEYTRIPDGLRRDERLLDGFPPNRAGLRWRHVDGSVLFSGSHTFPIPYARFVAAVDIARCIQYMNDYIGGATVAVKRDRRNRVTHQAERNIYLQQPNWMVIFGGDLIDVEKLELIEYARDRRTMSWRTIGSPNGSATFDDGSVSFIRAESGRTTVKIFARQKFSLPLLFQAFDINMAPGIRDPIIDSAYTTFFSGTISNIQSAYEGRDYRIGRDVAETGASDGVGIGDLARHLATAAAAVVEVLRHKGSAGDSGGFGSSPTPGKPRTFKDLDADGFRHFTPPPEGSFPKDARGGEEATVAGLASLLRDAPDFVAGLADAVRKDLDRVATSANGGVAS